MRKEYFRDELLIVTETFLEIREFEKALVYLQELFEDLNKSKKEFTNKNEICIQLQTMIENIMEILVVKKDQTFIDGEIAIEALIWYNLACIYSLKKDKIKSQSILQKAQELNPIIGKMATEESSMNFALWSRNPQSVKS